MTKRAEKLVILLVEDLPDCVELFRHALAKSELKAELWAVMSAEAGADFVRKRGIYKDFPLPDYAFVDIRLPGESGFNLARMIKADKTLSKIKVWILTGSLPRTAFDLAQAFTECDGVIEKPIQAQQLKEILRCSKTATTRTAGS